jgi:hypothetical protein
MIGTIDRISKEDQFVIIDLEGSASRMTSRAWRARTWSSCLSIYLPSTLNWQLRR